MEDFPRFKNVGERAILVELGDCISIETSSRLRALGEALMELGHKGIKECIQGYTSILVLYDPLNLDPEGIKGLIFRIGFEGRMEAKTRQVIEIPVCYGGGFGPDLDFVASYNSISTQRVVELHSSTLFTVFMMGFVPGFSYMGIVPEGIRAPRLESPRLSVPEGSVGIAEAQTGIYPTKSPGGWRIIGRTPIKVFDPKKEDPFYLKPGDRVMFVSISEEEFGIIREEPWLWEG